MNKQLASLIVTLLIFPFGAEAAPTDSDKVTEPQATPTGLQPDTAVSDENKAPEKTEIEKASAADKAVEPITGAFGIQLGEQFDASMVAKVLSKQEHSYKGQGGIKLKGQLLRIEPSKPDERFQQYSLKTTEAGIIYAIQGDYKYKVESDETKLDESKPKGSGKGAGKPGNKQPATAIQKTCKAAVKTMAGELESRYGKPRGQGWDGLWFTFRQPSDTSNRGLKLYGHRCRSGMYSIVYIDDKVQRGTQPGKAGTSPETGAPATGSASAKLEPDVESGAQSETQPGKKP
jgi:hypothetical protein